MDCLHCLREGFKCSISLGQYNKYYGKVYSCELLLWTPGPATNSGSAKCGGKEHIQPW